jgi:prepilin-type N-terminal cleavage/methylation domain-containing protein/prepilin-type processing-associated H-X9-DG protein
MDTDFFRHFIRVHPCSSVVTIQDMKRIGFTLVEMLVVIGIIAILIALLIPALTTVEEHANKTKCRSNVHQAAVGAVQLFEDAGDFLPGRANPVSWGEASEQLLPYVKNVIEIFDCPGNDDINLNVVACKFPSFDKYTDYELNGYLANPPNGSQRQSEITDYSQAAYIYDYPFNTNTTPVRAHEGGINIGYLDGHASWVEDKDLGLDGGSVSNEFYKRGHSL